MLFRLLLFIIYLSPIYLQSQEEIWKNNSNKIIEEKAEKLKIGIICAFEEEMGQILKYMDKPYQIIEKAKRTYFLGKVSNINTVLVISNIGKVAASITTTNLISQFNVDLVIFTGVAGAINENLNIGDVIIGKGLIQYDFDASPFFPCFEIPFLKIQTFEPDDFLQKKGFHAVEKFFENQLRKKINSEILNKMNIKNPKVTYGVIATADHFLSNEQEKIDLKKKIPEVSCVEMEGAAIAQVCHEYNIPCLIIRTISDKANKKANIDFMDFIQNVANVYSENIIKNIYEELFFDNFKINL